MGIKRDGVVDLAMLPVEDVTVTVGATELAFYSSAFDTAGFDDGLSVGASLSRELVAVDDDIEYGFETSKTGTGDWEAVPDEGILPTWKQPNNRLEPIDGGTIPYIQTFGCFNTYRYVRVKLTRHVVTGTSVIVSLTRVMKSLEQPFAGWSENPPPNDGRP